MHLCPRIWAFLNISEAERSGDRREKFLKIETFLLGGKDHVVLYSNGDLTGFKFSLQIIRQYSGVGIWHYAILDGLSLRDFSAAHHIYPYLRSQDLAAP
jgi:hypothetical protein